MRRNHFKKWGRYPSLLGLALIMLLSACAHTGKDDSKMDDGEIFSYPVQTKITIGTAKKTVNQTLKKESSLVQVLNEYGAKGNNLKEKIKYLQKANGKATSGLGGIYGHMFLDDAEKHLKESGGGEGNWNENVSVTQEVFGQITDYSRDESTGAGLLHVTTLVITTRSNPGNSPKLKIVAYHWQVEVDPGGFTVHKNCLTDPNVNCDPAHPEQPFPGTMMFDADMLQTVVDRNMEYKLWAKGTKINVINVYKYKKKIPVGTMPQPPLLNPTHWKRLSESKYAGLYTSSNDSCIDMMTEDFPPTDIANLPPVPFYCLGRCEHPAIINSR